MTPLLIDNFAGGGGASTGIEAAMGRAVDVAINHDPSAIAVHQANHPHTRHYCQSIYSVDPLEATGGEPVLLAWFSPDCKHHSKAKGGKPREKYIRDMAWVVPHWIERLTKATRGHGAPQVIMLENVEEFRQWGPLDAEGKPIPERKGEEFDLWVRRIKRAGYKVEWRELRACDYGAPTSRKRLFLIARRDGLPIVWPDATHGHPDSEGVKSGKLQPWRTAAECIDWTLPCPSIFDRKRPLKDATCRRTAAGVMRYVVNAAKPFIVGTAFTNTRASRVFNLEDPLRTITAQPEHAVVVPSIVPVTQTGWNPDRTIVADKPLPTITTAKGGEMALACTGIVPLTHQGADGRVYDPAAPIPTITGAHRGEMALSAASLVKLRNNSHGEDPAAPLGTINAGGQHHGIAAVTMVQTGYGEAPGQAPRALDVQAPLGTVVAGGAKHAAVSAFLAQHNTERGERANPGIAADRPLSTITGRGTQQQPVQVTMIEAGTLPPDMLHRAQLVAAFLVKYYGSGGENEGSQIQPVDRPMDTITAKARFAVVTVTIDAVTFVLVDIGMRMLTPRELANAQGFPPTYVLDPECWYVTDSGAQKFGRLPKSHQIARIGNSVCPAMSEALCRANLAHAIAAESEAA
jgi:DNA (cytosine-5)-methyltransferase 1